MLAMLNSAWTHFSLDLVGVLEQDRADGDGNGLAGVHLDHAKQDVEEVGRHRAVYAGQADFPAGGGEGGGEVDDKHQAVNGLPRGRTCRDCPDSQGQRRGNVCLG
jgi:hypothetical protein